MQCFSGRLFHLTDSTLHCRGKTCHFDLTVKNSPRVICQRQPLSAGAKHNFIKTSLFLLCAAAIADAVVEPVFTARSAPAPAIITFLSAFNATSATERAIIMPRLLLHDSVHFFCFHWYNVVWTILNEEHKNLLVGNWSISMKSFCTCT